MVALVEQMFALQKPLPEARTPHEQTALPARIEAIDGEIDAQILRAVRAAGGRDQDCGGESIAEADLILFSNSKKHGV
jgi:hypothetical protein